MADKLKTVNVQGVEILRVGTFTGVAGGRQTYTAGDLREMAEAHEALTASGHWPTVYLGHNLPDLPEPPAVGRIVRLAVKGDKLVADLEDVPALVGQLMEVKAYGSRSIEGFRLGWAKAMDIGGKSYRQVLTGLALLGKSLPAVSGLADVEKLYTAAAAGLEAEDSTVVMLGGGDVDPVEEALAGLDTWAELALELIKGRTFAPAIRQRIRMLKEDFRRIAGTTTVEAKMDLRKALSLAPDATDSDITTALVKLAGASDPATAMAVIAEILGVPDAEPSALVAKVRELAGGGSASADPAAPEGGTAMSKKPTAEADATVVKLQQAHTDLLGRLAKLEGDRAREAAATAVDREIKAGRFVPAQRETLVAMALHDLTAFETLAGATPVNVLLGEKGTSGAADAADLEPAADQVKVMMAAGYSADEARDALRRKAHADRGLTYAPKKD